MQKRTVCANFLPIVFILLILLAVITISIPFAKAQMLELSEIQNNIFFLSHKDASITPATFKTDRYIDDEQADYFNEISRPKIFTPADNNYSFTLVDHYILDSDLAIEYKYDNILCSAYPPKAFLSRHNISIADYTDTKVPPTYYISEIKGVDPFTGEKVTAMHLEVNNYENSVNEIIYTFNKIKSIKQKNSIQYIVPRQNTEPPGEYMSGYATNIYLRVYSAQSAVWVRLTDTDLMKRCNPPIQYTTCLHPSDIRPRPEPFRIIRLPSDNPCIGELIFSEPPRSNCYYPLPPERKTAAATNWSYNYNLRNNSPASDLTDNRRATTAQTDDTTCQTCR